MHAAVAEEAAGVRRCRPPAAGPGRACRPAGCGSSRARRTAPRPGPPTYPASNRRWKPIVHRDVAPSTFSSTAQGAVDVGGDRLLAEGRAAGLDGRDDQRRVRVGRGRDHQGVDPGAEQLVRVATDSTPEPVRDGARPGPGRRPRRRASRPAASDGERLRVEGADPADSGEPDAHGSSWGRDRSVRWSAPLRGCRRTAATRPADLTMLRRNEAVKRMTQCLYILTSLVESRTDERRPDGRGA